MECSSFLFIFDFWFLIQFGLIILCRKQRTYCRYLYNSCKAQQKAANKTNHKTYPICIPSFLYPVAFVTYWLCHHATYWRSDNFRMSLWNFRFSKKKRKIWQISALEYKKWSNHQIKALYNTFNLLNHKFDHLYYKKVPLNYGLITF